MAVVCFHLVNWKLFPNVDGSVQLPGFQNISLVKTTACRNSLSITSKVIAFFRSCTNIITVTCSTKTETLKKLYRMICIVFGWTLRGLTNGFL